MPVNKELFPKRDEVQEELLLVNEELLPKRGEVQIDGYEEDIERNDKEENIAEVVEKELVHPIMKLKQPLEVEDTDRAARQEFARKWSAAVDYYVPHGSSTKKKRKKVLQKNKLQVKKFQSGFLLWAQLCHIA